MTKIYYFSPNCDCELINAIPYMGEWACQNESESNSEVTCYTPEQFEIAFNDERISDLGYIKIF